MDIDGLTPDPELTEESVTAFAGGEPTPEPRRKRGRPKKAAAAPETPPLDEEAAEPLDAPMPPREEPESAADRKKGRKEGESFAPPPAKAYAIDCEMIGFGCAAIFGVIATVTHHDHWLRTPKQCEPISQPLARMIARMPAKQRKALTQTLDPAVLLAGIYQVAGPSIDEEARLIQMRRAGLVTPARATGSAAAEAPPPASPAGGPADPGKIVSLQGIVTEAGVIQ